SIEQSDQRAEAVGALTQILEAGLDTVGDRGDVKRTRGRRLGIGRMQLPAHDRRYQLLESSARLASLARVSSREPPQPRIEAARRHRSLAQRCSHGLSQAGARVGAIDANP